MATIRAEAQRKLRDTFRRARTGLPAVPATYAQTSPVYGAAFEKVIEFIAGILQSAESAGLIQGGVTMTHGQSYVAGGLALTLSNLLSGFAGMTPTQLASFVTTRVLVPLQQMGVLIQQLNVPEE